MQGAAGEAALRQAGIKGGKAEGQGFALLRHPGQQAAQFLHDGGAISRHGRNAVAAVAWLCMGSLDIHCMFLAQAL